MSFSIPFADPSSTSSNSRALANLCRDERTCGQKIVDGAAKTAVSAVAGAITAAIFTSFTFTPLVGAAFGAVCSLTGEVANGVIGAATGNSPTLRTCIKIVAIIPIYIASIAAALFVTASLGFPVTFFSGFLFSLAMIVGGIALGAIKFGLSCVSDCLGGAALAATERRA